MSHGTIVGNQIPQTSTFNRNLTKPTTWLMFRPCSFPTRGRKTQPVLSSRMTGRLRAVSVAQPSGGTTATTLYDLLGVPESGTLPEIKQAYRKLAREYHPDLSPAEYVKENTEKFIELQEAYETLSDPNKRASYDRHLVSGLHLAFSCRNQIRDKQVWDVMGGRSQWEYQVAELKRRSNLREKTSWAARIRKQEYHQDDVI